MEQDHSKYKEKQHFLEKIRPHVPHDVTHAPQAHDTFWMQFCFYLMRLSIRPTPSNLFFNPKTMEKAQQLSSKLDCV